MNPATMHKPKILYFIEDSTPTEDEIKGAMSLDANVVFRNAKFVENDGAYEEADGVAGAVPPRYRDALVGDKKKFPDAKTAIKNFEEKRLNWNDDPNLRRAPKPKDNGPYETSDPGPQQSIAATIPAKGGPATAQQEKDAAEGKSKGNWQRNA